MAEMNTHAREARNEYYRRWRAKNREKVKESNRKYWERRAAQKAVESAENGKKGGSELCLQE